MTKRFVAALVCVLAIGVHASPDDSASASYQQQIRTFHTTRVGLPSDDVVSLASAPDGTLYAGTAKGLARFQDGRWTTVPNAPQAAVEALATAPDGVVFAAQGGTYRISNGSLRQVGKATGSPISALAVVNNQLLAASANELVGDSQFGAVAGPEAGIRFIVTHRDGSLAVAAATGLYERRAGAGWARLLPDDGRRSWAPKDVRSATYTTDGQLCFVSRAEAGCRKDNRWTLLSREDGLPYDDLRSIGLAPDGSMWLGSSVGAMRRTPEGKWEYRQGLRWLPADTVRAVVADEGGAWLATPAGIARISTRPMTLAEKARFFESEIDKRHRRTEYGYVLSVAVASPGDATQFTQVDSDNDGLWTSMYGAGEAFACGAGLQEACPRAAAAYRALEFLGTVTQGGSHPAPPGYVARTILPASGPDPNLQYTPERDAQFRATRDSLWKVMRPRWPLSADKKWYWKADTSSDELDGHYFFYGAYYDLVANEDEKRRVRKHVAALTDHLLTHNFQLIDHDGKVTRWGVFNPEALNRDTMWWEERGLNSLSILAYLKTAEHITGDTKYAEAARLLRERHAYDFNTLIPKSHAGAGAGNHSDDEMAFMCLYNLLRYETDSRLRSIYGFALRRRWEMEQPELNPLFNYIAVAALKDLRFTGSHRTIELRPHEGDWRSQSLDTLQRFPLDRFNWSFRNSHRLDVVRLSKFIADDEARRGHLRSESVLPVDERYVEYWNHDPWRLDGAGNGKRLADGAAFLLPYYLGLYHGLLAK